MTTQHQGKMPARREADRADAIRIDPVLLGVGLDPAHRRLDVVDLSRKRLLGAKPVLREIRDISVPHELGHDRPHVGLVAGTPRTAMDDQDRRKRPFSLVGPMRSSLSSVDPALVYTISCTAAAFGLSPARTGGETAETAQATIAPHRVAGHYTAVNLGTIRMTLRGFDCRKPSGRSAKGLAEREGCRSDTSSDSRFR